eukprot:m.99395 g.99395  ORF g.99395 m.99395 type:complete len:272 (-) comp22170_c1_seq1:450-1265(-)
MGQWWSFSAISKKSRKVEEAYELAGEMDDLQLGDAHAIELDEKRPDGTPIIIALIVAQSRDSQNHISGILLQHLDKGFQRVAALAQAHDASVHLPRIGHGSPNFNWYGTERLIRKRFATIGIQAFVYYYRRHRGNHPQLSKRPTAPPRATDIPGAPRSSSLSPSSSSVVVSPETTTATIQDEAGWSEELPDFFSGNYIYMHNIDPSEEKRLKRLVVAYDGVVCTTIDDETTHVLTAKDDPEDQFLNDVKSNFPSIEIVDPAWMKTTIQSNL